MPDDLSIDGTVEIRAGETRAVGIDFKPLLASGTSLSTVSSATTAKRTPGSANLTAASAAVSGTVAEVLVSGGTAGARYELTVTATTSTETLVGRIAVEVTR